MCLTANEDESRPLSNVHVPSRVIYAGIRGNTYVLPLLSVFHEYSGTAEGGNTECRCGAQAKM